MSDAVVLPQVSGHHVTCGAAPAQPSQQHLHHTDLTGERDVIRDSSPELEEMTVDELRGEDEKRSHQQEDVQTEHAIHEADHLEVPPTLGDSTQRELSTDDVIPVQLPTDDTTIGHLSSDDTTPEQILSKDITTLRNLYKVDTTLGNLSKVDITPGNLSKDDTASGLMSKDDSTPAQVSPDCTTPTDTVMPVLLSSQIHQLQDLVHEIKHGFTGAMLELARIQYGDLVLQEKVDTNKAEYEHQLADVVTMVIALKSEFGSIVGRLESANDKQQALQNEVEGLRYERDILLEELEKAGVISPNLRDKYHSGQSRPRELNKSGDSTTLSILLERARAAFQAGSANTSVSSGHMTSEHDSGVNTYQAGEVSSCETSSPPVMSPIVKSYIEGLQRPERVDELRVDEPHYGSNTSLTMAANRSLDLSRSLGDCCEMRDDIDLEDEVIEAEEQQHKVFEEDNQDKDGVYSAHTSPTQGPTLSPFSKTSSPRGSLAPHERNARETHRLRVAQEIVDTERKYCSCLWTLIDHFASNIKRSGLVSEKDYSVMFPSSLWELYQLHCGFLQKLENRMATWRGNCVMADIFAQFLQDSETIMQYYQQYVKEFPNAQHQIRKSCRSSGRFRKLMKSCHDHPICVGLDIGSFLLTPIQRMPRYVLLLKQLLKHTNAEHPDYFYIENSLQKFSTFLTELNQSIECSMQAVAAETPKVKRKLRVPSFRTNTSTREARDSMVANGILPDKTYPSSRPSSGRMFQISMIKESATAGMSALISSTPVTRQQKVDTVPRVTVTNASGNRSFHFPASHIDHSRDKTFTGDHSDSRTLPRGEKKRRPRQRRPKSAVQLSPAVEALYTINGFNTGATPECGSGKCTRSHRQRPASVVVPPDQHTSQDYLPGAGSSQTPGYVMASNNAAVLVDADTGCSTPRCSRMSTTLPMQSGYNKQNSQVAVENPVLPSACFSLQNVDKPSSPKSATTISLCADYGIYGEDDPLEQSVYVPSACSRGGGDTVDTVRCHSRGEMHRQGSSVSVSQEYINQALAHSLSEEPLNHTISTPQAATAEKYARMHTQVRHESAGTPEKPDGIRENVWEEPSLCDISMTDSCGTSRSMLELRRKKKPQKTKSSEFIQPPQPNKPKRKMSFSLKNIFFRKRTSKVVEMATSDSPPPSHNHSSRPRDPDDLELSDHPPYRTRLTPQELGRHKGSDVAHDLNSSLDSSVMFEQRTISSCRSSSVRSCDLHDQPPPHDTTTVMSSPAPATIPVDKSIHLYRNDSDDDMFSAV